MRTSNSNLDGSVTKDHHNSVSLDENNHYFVNEDSLLQILSDDFSFIPPSLAALRSAYEEWKPSPQMATSQNRQENLKKGDNKFGKISSAIKNTSVMLELRDRIAHLEAELLKNRADSEAQVYLLNHKVELLERNLSESQKQCKKLEKQRRILFDANERLEKHVGILVNDFEILQSRTSTGESKLESEKFNLGEELHSLQMKYNHEQAVQHQKQSLLETSVMALEKEVQVLQERCKKLSLEKNDLSLTLMQRESEIGQLESKSSNILKQSVLSESLDIRSKELDRQQSYIQQLELDKALLKRQCEQLQMDRSQVSILQEEKLHLQQRLKGIESLRSMLIAKEGECEVLQAQLVNWSAHDWTPVDARKAIDRAESTVQMEKERVQLLEDRIASLHSQMETMTAELNDSHAKLDAMDKAYWSMYTKFASVEKLVGIKQDEIDDLKQQLNQWTEFTESHSMQAPTTERSDIVRKSLDQEYRHQALDFKWAIEWLFGFQLENTSETILVVSSDLDPGRPSFLEVSTQNTSSSSSEISESDQRGQEDVDMDIPKSAFIFTRSKTGIHFKGFSDEGADRKYRELAELWMTQRNCIPGFLSALTLLHLKERFRDSSSSNEVP